MTGSFERIDYSLRPAKHAERKMLCDIFRRVSPFERVENYVYVGFGSVWFSDFSLFHRALGVKEMVSIEQVEAARDRIEENKPFNIPVDYRESKHALPDLNWSRKQFLWLDYDDPLSIDMLLDMRSVARRASSGSVLAVSVQCMKAVQVAEAAQDQSAVKPKPIDLFVNVFGRDRVPQEAESSDLYGWPYGELSRRLIMQEIQQELASRNSINKTDFFAELICNIEYVDGAKMTTLVVIFYDQKDRMLVDQCGFGALDFLTPGNRTVRIAVPKLTIREFRRLESQLPLAQGVALNLGSIPQAEARHFESMYRYFPNFAAMEN